MAKYLYTCIYIIIIIAFLSSPFNLYANEVITYKITTKQIDTIRIIEINENRYLVVLNLKHSYMKELAELTDTNIGKELQIIFLNKILSRFLIEQSIRLEEFKIEELPTRKAAFDLMKMILMNEDRE